MIIRIVFAIAMLFGLLTTASSAQAASFDCAKASTRVEKIICNNQELSDLDAKMDQVYRDSLSAYDYYKGLEVTSDQRKWIKITRSACKDVACIKNAYLLRIDELNAPFNSKQNQPHNIFLKDVIVKTQNGAALLVGNPHERISSFNDDLVHRRLHGKITQCKTLIDVPVGTSHGNHSYGGLCNYSEGDHNSNVMICNDEMVGHFKIHKTDREISIQELVDFVVSNCFGG